MQDFSFKIKKTTFFNTIQSVTQVKILKKFTNFSCTWKFLHYDDFSSLLKPLLKIKK